MCNFALEFVQFLNKFFFIHVCFFSYNITTNVKNFLKAPSIILATNRYFLMGFFTEREAIVINYLFLNF